MKVTNSTLVRILVDLDETEQFDYTRRDGRVLVVESLTAGGPIIEARGHWRRKDGTIGGLAGCEYPAASDLPEPIRTRVVETVEDLRAALTSVLP